MTIVETVVMVCMVALSILTAGAFVAFVVAVMLRIVSWGMSA